MGNSNVERFINGTVHYFKVIGFEFENKNPWMQILLIVSLVNMIIVLLGQLMFMALSDDDLDLQERTAGISYMNYYLVSVGKIIALLYNRSDILETLNEFRPIYPSVRVEKAYNLQTYLKQYLLIEKFLAGFFRYITFFYCAAPLTLSFTSLAKGRDFTNRTPMRVWYPFDTRDRWILYAFDYFFQVHTTVVSAIIILGLDLCLFSSLLQLCMHFDIINRNILLIEPDESEEAENRLKEQIAYHQRVLRSLFCVLNKTVSTSFHSLAERVNDIFTPSILFSLLSSSFILCFTVYQLLGDMNLFISVKAIILLFYELKQVVITCFLGDRLVEMSTRVSDGVYSHKWYDGTPKYKRMVLLVLMRSQRSAALHIAGVSDVSLQTLRQVMSISYQIFTVLKTG